MNALKDKAEGFLREEDGLKKRGGGGGEMKRIYADTQEATFHFRAWLLFLIRQ